VAEDWTKTRAREWLEETLGPVVVQHAYHQFSDAEVSSLAALLREVDGRARSETLVMCCVCHNAKAPRPDCECVICHRNRTLAEVRRVVLDVRASSIQPTAGCFDAPLACDDILARLEKL
jgi:hypothetical protein